MAERGVRSVSELARRLEEIGVSISISQLGRMIDGKTQLWNQDVIEGMMTVLDCELSDIIR
jgi:biotin operon repressor